MRNINIILSAVWILVVIFPSICFAQESQGGIPRSLSRESGLNDIIPTLYFAPPSANEIREVIDYNNNSSECQQFAIGADSHLGVRESARRDSLEDGILYRVAIVSKGATSISILFFDL